EPGAYAQSISSNSGDSGTSMISYTFNIAAAGGKGGTWYFWGRVINPDNSSDFMLVDGHPGDEVPFSLPVGGLVDDQRVFEQSDLGDSWIWAPTAGSAGEEAHTKQLKDTENTMYILSRQSGAIWDVFMWTDDAGYIPTDEDYENAIPGGGYGPVLKPVPADGSFHPDTWVSLEWRPGDFAVSHDVYFGDNFDDVNDGTGDAFRGNHTTDFFIVGFPGNPYPDGLVPGTTYYWRIDEVNDADPNSPWRGPVWSFTVPSKTAYAPYPDDGAKYIDIDVELSWTAGLLAKLHTVFFGDSFEDVNDAVVGSPQPGTTYTPGTLEKDKTYYWRIDEFAADGTHKGNVWSFKTLPDIPINDPDFAGWWKLDEGAGTLALDWSGHDNHATLVGNPEWVAGFDGDGLDLDGSGDNLNAGSTQLSTDAFTVALWFNPNSALDSSSPRQDFLYWQSGDRPHLTFNRSGTGEIGLWPSIESDFDGPETATKSWAADTWYHIAGTFDGTIFKIYVNGNMESSVSHPGTHNDASGLLIGCRTSQRNYFAGKIDDVRLYDKALKQDEIQEAMRGDPALAWNAKPVNGSMPYIEDATPLSWSPGENATQHDVYFGIDRDAVENAYASDTTGVYRVRQSTATYTPPEGIEWGGGPYYWRIDQVNADGSISIGRIWTFTVADFVLIDDFESYDAGDNQIWYSWHDGLGYGTVGIDPYFAGNGTGAAVGDETTASYTEETIVHGGGQSMPISYDNNKQGYAYYSEAELTLTAPRDWTEDGVAELSIWFQGRPASAGSFVENPAGTYTIAATGEDIWNAADQFHYAFKTLTGVGTIVAQVVSVDNTDPWAKAGVMFRETLDAGSKFAAVYITPGNGCRFQARTDTDIDATSDTSVATAEQMAIVAPYWVKLERDFAGNFRGYYSANGTTWQPMSWNPRNISMTSNVYVGLALTSHNNAAIGQAVFSNVTITGTVGPQWASQDVGIESNAAEPLYVAVSNSDGAPAVVIHDDPAAANIDTWTEWVIPLQAFADQGIVLTDVDRIAIGLGTKGNITTPGGSGKMYIDDIRLYR
ncbi:MAG: LamG domain-containing protein, partial [Planctomycetota bacterium]